MVRLETTKKEVWRIQLQKAGDTNKILKLKTKETSIIDLEGKTLVPGFNDSHMHQLSYASYI